MIERKPDEIAADEVMEFIAYCLDDSWLNTIKHLTALHKLRDEKLYHDLLPTIWNMKRGRPENVSQIIWDMQTF